METSNYPTLEIDTQALENNLSLIRSLTTTSQSKDNCKILVPVKANAYGCGIETILPFIEKFGVNMLGVANPFEAVHIRKCGFYKEILLLGSFYKEQAGILFQEDVIPSITDLWQIMFLDQEAKIRKTTLKVHIKFDLGMGRLGIQPDQKEEFLRRFVKTSHLRVGGIMTHFPSGERKSSLLQLKDFLKISEEVIRKLSLRREEVILHSANSYAILNYPESALDMIRPGLMFYGYFHNYKDQKKLKQRFPVRPCMRLIAKPFSYRRLKKGARVSYASLYKVRENNYPVAVLPLGYADGLPVALSNQISFDGFPLLGRVTMDQIILGGVNEDTKSIEVLGPNSPPLEYWAEKAGTISYEIMVGLGQRLRRVLV